MKSADPENPNRHIYDTVYSGSELVLYKEGMLAYDKEMISLRLELLKKYGAGKTVLDLCCGAGDYLLQEWGAFPLAVGVDFSRNMLSGFKKKLDGKIPANLLLLQGDARQIGLQAEVVDFVYSFTSLYYVPQVARALAEIGRVLRPGGMAVFELGNQWSLNTHVCLEANRKSGIAKPFHISSSAMRKAVQEAKLTVLEHRVFQILPMWGGGWWWLRPLTDWRWKWLMGLKIGGRMLDEWISSLWPIRLLAFRHLFVCQKPNR